VSGTVNYISKFTPNGTSLGNSIIYENGTDIGIGTLTPGSKLDVQGDIFTRNTIYFGAVAGSVVPICTLGLNGSGDLVFDDTTATQNFIFSNSGQVTIGTTDVGTPIYGLLPQLTVASATGGVLDIRTTYTGVVANTSLGRIQFTGKSDSAVGYTAAAIEAISNGTSSSGSNGGGILKLMTSTSGYGTPPLERMRISSLGNVGIGTTNPGERLDVAGIIRTVYLDPTGIGGITAKFLSYAGSPYGLVYRTYSTGQWSIQNQREANDGETWSISLQHLGGNVGIGTLTPGSKLTVGERASVDGNVRLSAAGSGVDAGASLLWDMNVGGGNAISHLAEIRPESYATGINKNILNFYVGAWNNNANSGTPKMTITSDGLMGIGTSNPTQFLDIVTSSGNSFISLDGASYANSGILFKGNSIERGRILVDGSANMLFSMGSSATEAMRIISTGLVGMGTTTPTAKLNVKSTGSTTTVDYYFLDTYNRATITSGGTPATTYTTQAGNITIGTLGTAPNANPNTVFLGAAGLNAVSAPWPVFPSNNYLSQLNANGALLTWAVNARQSFSGTMTGFGSGGTGQAIVLACNLANPASTSANGWALVYGRSGNNSWSLCHFTGGLNATGTITIVIGPSAISTEARVYYSLKVTYAPQSNAWNFYYRNDTPTASVGLWTNPTTGTFTLVGSATDATYTNVSLPYFASVYQSTSSNGYFTNFSLSNTAQLFPDSLKIEDGNNKQTNGYTVLENLSGLNTTTDFTAAALGVPLYGLYRTGNVLRVRTGTNTDGIVFTTGAQTIDGIKTFVQNTTFNGTVTASGGFFNSDARLKNVLERDGDTVKFTWKDKRDGKIHIGYIAQEVQEKYPDQVNESTDGMLTVNYIEVLVAKIQELENRIKQLEK